MDSRSRFACTWLPLLALLCLTTGCEEWFADTRGERLWLRHCAECHGRQGTGNTPQLLGNKWVDLTDDHWKVAGDDLAIRQAIRDGVVGSMPAYDFLTREEVDHIIHHLRVLRGERFPKKE